MCGWRIGTERGRTGVFGSRNIGSVKLDDVTLFCVELLSLKLSGKSSNSNAAATTTTTTTTTLTRAS